MKPVQFYELLTYWIFVTWCVGDESDDSYEQLCVFVYCGDVSHMILSTMKKINSQQI